MARYYKPKEEELVVGLAIEFYADSSWHEHVLTFVPKWLSFLRKDNIRIKYLDSIDFNALGYIIKKTFLGKQINIKEILIDGTEITEEISIFDEEICAILKNNVEVGKFLPHAPNVNFNYNVVYKDKKHVVKNITELTKILK